MDNSDNEQDEFAELTPHQMDLLVQLQDLTGKDVNRIFQDGINY